MKIPKTEVIWMTYLDSSGQAKFIVTSKENSRDYYFLYRVLDDDSVEKLGKSKFPDELRKKYNIDKEIKG